MKNIYISEGTALKFAYISPKHLEFYTHIDFTLTPFPSLTALSNIKGTVLICVCSELLGPSALQLYGPTKSYCLVFGTMGLFDKK